MRDDAAGFATAVTCLFISVQDFGDVVAVYLLDEEAERLEALDISINIMLKHSNPSLPKPVHINNRDQVIELIVAGELCSLPDLALLGLTVTDDAEIPVVDPFQIL